MAKRVRLSEREVAILRVLTNDTDAKRGFYAGRLGSLAGFKKSGRIDAGTTRTLDSMERKGFVRFEYDHNAIVGWAVGGRRWWVTDDGRTALGEYAFGE